MKNLVLCAAFSLLSWGAEPKSPAGAKSELEAMFDSDQSQIEEMTRVRKTYGEDSPQMKTLFQKQKAINEANSARLSSLIDKDGWPDRRVVGEKAANGAFLVLQHADYAYQKKYLPMFREAVAADKARRWHLPLLEDRVLVREGKPQLYGTQWRMGAKGVMERYPIEDEANVDKRRAAYGLPPLSEEKTP